MDTDVFLLNQTTLLLKSIYINATENTRYKYFFFKEVP